MEEKIRNRRRSGERKRITPFDNLTHMETASGEPQPHPANNISLSITHFSFKTTTLSWMLLITPSGCICLQSLLPRILTVKHSTWTLQAINQALANQQFSEIMSLMPLQYSTRPDRFLLNKLLMASQGQYTDDMKILAQNWFSIILFWNN